MIFKVHDEWNASASKKEKSHKNVDFSAYRWHYIEWKEKKKV